MSDEPTFDRLLVVLDPSARDGDSGAFLARTLVGADGHIELAVPLSGPAAQALQRYAESESITVKEAAEIYLRQTIQRIGGSDTTGTLLDGSDLAVEVAAAVTASNSGGAVMSRSMADRAMTNRTAWDAIGFPVLVIPPYRVAA
jgi:hypothetical protein